METPYVLREVQELENPDFHKHPRSAVVIWVVVGGDDVFVRSWLGDTRGAGTRTWQRAAPPRWSLPGCRLPVQAIPASDAASVEHASREILRKYRHSNHAQEMVPWRHPADHGCGLKPC